MKAILIVCFLLASTFFIPASKAARELSAEYRAVTDPTRSVTPCSRGLPYTPCLPKIPPSEKGCTIYSREGCHP
ncbi:hypothetical protein ACJW30_01G190800 [Castanea mollissima]